MEEMLPPENPMGTAKISGLVLKTGLPLMISLLINSLYNFVDSVFVARISEEALTALSLAAPVQIIMSAMGLGIAVGLNAVISRALGEKNQDRAIGVVALRIMAVSYLLSNVCLTFSSAFQGLGMGVQSMLLTLSRQVIMPVLLIAAASWFGELSLIWWAFVLAEALVIPAGMILWKKESGKSLGALTVMCSE